MIRQTQGFKRALAVVMTAVLTVGSVSYSGPAERAKAAQSSTSLTKAETDELYTKHMTAYRFMIHRLL